MRLITHMEPSQLRLGYLCCLALVAGRQLDTRQGLIDRLKRFVFQTVETRDPRWRDFKELVDETQLQRMQLPLDEKLAELRDLFCVKDTVARSYQLQALWLAQKKLPSHLGLLTEKNTVQILKMGRSFDILTTGYALSEKGVFLQNFLNSALPGVLDGAPGSNPFAIDVELELKLFFLYLLLTVDVLTPFLISEFASAPEGDLPNSPKLLPLSAKRLVDAVEAVTDISAVASLRQCRDYATRLETKAVAKNQAQPRYHHLFELGLLKRVDAGLKGRRMVPYVPTAECQRAADVLGPLRENLKNQQDTIDKGFFGWCAAIYELTAKRCDSDIRRLYFFAKGFPYLEREIGFTPGRTVAIAGCLMALKEGWIIEVAEMFDVLHQMAAGPWRRYLEYSGGSRLDQEFLVKVRRELIPAVTHELENLTNSD